MMGLENAGRRFESRIQIENGQAFYGQFLEIPDTTRVSNFNSARRLLRTSRNSTVQIGQIIVDAYGIFWMVGEHGQSENRHHYFKLFQADLQLSWERETTEESLLTGLKGGIARVLVGQIRGTYERRTDETGSAFPDEPANLFITNADLKRNDLVDNRKVIRIDHQLGLTIAELAG